MVTLDRLITNQSNEFPDKVAIKHGERAFTYKSVSEVSNQLSVYFKKQGINAGDVVAIAIDRSPEMIISLLSVVKSGATYLPLDASFPIDRISYMLKDSSAKVLVTSKKLQSKFEGHANLIFIEDALQESADYDSQSFAAEINDDTIAYILYTSGSTGNPKGVEVKHAGLVNLLLSVQEEPGCRPEDTVLLTTTISFDIAELEVFLPLISGATLIIADAESVKDGRALLDIAKSEGITIMQGTPFMWRMMLEAGWNERLPFKVFCGGEAMTKELAKNLVTKCASLWNMYGPTETTIYSIIKRVSVDDKIITVGHPILNTQVYILNDNLDEVSPGEVGEIYIGGTGVAKGYINKPELTNEKFIDDKFSKIEGQKIYRTGDLGKVLENGEIQCLGRIDHQIKIRGYRIETEEVEYQLKQQENVKEAIVTLYKDTLDNMHLVAYVAPKAVINNGTRIEYIKTWKAGLKNALPEYMVPDQYIVIPSIPLMPNGKTDRKSLPDPVMSIQASNKNEVPDSETEISLHKIFLKNIALNKLGVTDNFFELGIDSLVAVKIMLQIEKEFGKRLPLSILINYPTIRELALVIENGHADSSYKSLTAIHPAGSKLPLYIVHGLGLNVFNLYSVVSKLDKDQPVYGMQAVGLDGTVEPLDNMEEIARFYNAEIIKHDPVGPYAIAGYSFGGYIAFEMVKQLREMGKEVKLLGMFDTNIQYPTHQYPFFKRIGVRISRQFRKIKFRLGTIINEPGLTFAYLQVYYSVMLKLFLQKFGYFKDYHPHNLPPHMREIAVKLDVALDNYVFKPNDVKIDLFIGDTRMYYVDDPQYLGWGKYALNGINTYMVPGDHKEIFNPPNDAILARALQDVLNKIN